MLRAGRMRQGRKDELAQLSQPVMLVAGGHEAPEQGVCVVELASVIAGERFSDHPECVCPVIAGFLRAWNDRAGHHDRQRLMPYARAVVGSRRSRRLTRARRDMCLEWSGADLRRSRLRKVAARAGWRVWIGMTCGIPKAFRFGEGAGEYAARLSFARGDDKGAFGLLDAMLALGSAANGDGSVATANGNGLLNGWGHVNGNGHDPVNGHGHLNGNGNGQANTNGAPAHGHGHAPAGQR